MYDPNGVEFAAYLEGLYIVCSDVVDIDTSQQFFLLYRDTLFSGTRLSFVSLPFTVMKMELDGRFPSLPGTVQLPAGVWFNLDGTPFVAVGPLAIEDLS